MDHSPSVRRLASVFGVVLAAVALTFLPLAGAAADPPSYAFVDDSVPGRLTAGAAFTYQFTTTDDPSTFAVDQGELPPGLTLTAGGLLSGAVSESGHYSFQLRASHSASVVALGATHTVVVDPTLPLHLEPAYGDHQTANVSTDFIGPLAVRVVDDLGYPARDQDVVFTVRPYAPNRLGVLFTGPNPGQRAATSGRGGLAWTGTVYSLDTPVTAYVDVTLVTGPGSATFELTVKAKLVPSADLRLALSAPARATIKKRVAVKVRIDNLGPSSADQVVTTLTWPTGWTVVDPGAGTVSGRSLTFVADPVDSDLPLKYAVTLKASSHRGAVRLRATTTADTPDPSTTNNADRTTVTLHH